MKELKAFTIEAQVLPTFMDRGWGNGYVAIPKGHKLYEVDYQGEAFYDIEVNGGLTYGNYAENLLKDPEAQGIDPKAWVVGFDTAHYMDTLQRWPEEAVRDEANSLLEQIANP
jgi:hypothetical protein